MKKAFVNTENHKKAIALIKGLSDRGQGVPGLGLIYSKPGLGKSTSLARIAALMPECVMVRATAAMTIRWLLEAIVAELGVTPMRRTQDLFHQAVSHLIEERRVVMVDEVDYLCHDGTVINTLRDLHDIANTPVVFVGMGEVDKKLRRHPHLFARISQVVKFEPLSEKDVDLAARELCDLPVEPDAVKALLERSGGGFREVMVALNQAEKSAKLNGLKAVTGDLMKDLSTARPR